MIGQTLGRYSIREQIGAGGMGVVYRAHDERLNRDVALKVLRSGLLADESTRKRFREEALNLSRLNHPNIETVYDFDSQNGVDFLVMEFVAGSSLAEEIAAGPVVEDKVIRVGVQIAEGLSAAHQDGIVHCDLKPDNVRLMPDRRAKILDFGLSQFLRSSRPSPANERETVSELQVGGTLPYMAPEQVRGQWPDARVDVYALGAVLYEMSTGRRPFPEKDAPELMISILQRAPVQPRLLNTRMSAELERVILKCLEKDPEQRYQSAKEVAIDLQRLGSHGAAEHGIAEVQRPRRRWVLGLLAAAVLIALLLLALPFSGLRDRLLGRSGQKHIDSIAVLPLVNLSGNPAEDYFADGMTEALITQLAQIGSFRVVSRTSVMRYKGSDKPLPEIAKELHVNGIVEGSVQRAGDRVKVTAQLIDAPADQHLWASSYDRDLHNVLELESEVAAAIAGEINAKVTAKAQDRLARARPVNPEAHEAYLRGLYKLNEGRNAPVGGHLFEDAIKYFQQAIQIDPNYAEAYAALARAYHWLGSMGHDEYFPLSKAAATKALQLDDSLADAHTALAFVGFVHDWDWAASEREFRRAIELNPSYYEAHSGYALYLEARGRLDEAIRESQKALELAPFEFTTQANLGDIYECNRQYDRALETLRNVAELSPEDSLSRGGMAQVYVRMNQPQLAQEQARSSLQLSNNDDSLVASAAWVFAATGKKDDARRMLEQLKKSPDADPYLLATAYGALGDKDAAFRLLDEAYAKRNGTLVYIGCEPAFENFHSDPRYQALLRRMGLTQ